VELRPGERLRSVACSTEVIVVRARSGDVDLGCGGSAMVPASAEHARAELDPALASRSQIGKRYVDKAATIELLCTKTGEGTLTVSGAALVVKSARPLPSSD